MKKIVLTLLVTVSLVACSMQASALAQTTSNMATAPIVTSTTPAVTPTQAISDNAAEEVEIRDLVENFGKRLQSVSLLSSDAAQEIQKQYSEFVSPTLLEIWMSDVSRAPGRTVSSPWPDRIEITALAKEGSDWYAMTGYVAEVTSMEIINGGAAAKIPVRVVVQKSQGHWLITEYSEER